ncbi:hypothetical protein PYW08_015135 [Mythimna loreyi]|uniref:Uncharacterized protein n=1 Tax=Mythimna loreyi TaxID=667449 RepID=A0ACC2QXG7_9NEOP|nr:hypothetical protein PYW08_015135 [Mythimna loreyi]
MPKPKAFGKNSRKRLRALRCYAEKARQQKNESSCDTSIATDTSEVYPERYVQASCSTFDDNKEMLHNKKNKEIEPYQLTGRRIVEIGYFMKQLQEIGDHSSMFKCNLSTVQLLKERKTGLNSIFYLKCQMCGANFELKSSKDPINKMDVNEEVVAGIMTTGAGVTQLNTVLCHINIPPMSVRLYQSKHDIICRWWNKTAQHCMAEAGKEEKNHALSIGSVNERGIPMIPVSGDACWSKRSYGTNYSASSGVGAIIGIFSKKVLYYGVKNKMCSICSRAQSKGVQQPKHNCFKNFQGPSTAMEAEIITEGFKKSLGDHGLIYNQYVADGDASTYASIRNARPYEDVTVGKVECKNHLLRNYCKGLLSISNNTAYPIRARKFLKDNYLRIRWGVDSSVKYWVKQNIPFSEKMENIKNDITNGPYHIFGDHSKCASYFCSDEIKKRSENLVPELKLNGVFQKIEDLAYRLSFHAYSFVHNETNNLVESFNARVAKFVGGKRVNFSQRQSYGGRCAAAVISYNSGSLQSTVHKYIFGTEANPEIIRLECYRQQLNLKRLEKKVKKKKIVKSSISKDIHYGEECQKVDMDDKDYEVAKKEFLSKLEISHEAKVQLERDTILQSASPLWLETRRKLLTASWFSTICKRRPNSNCAPLVKQILYGRDLGHVPSIKHGKNNEYTALRDLEKVLNSKIMQCGLFIDEEISFLGASPDGKCELGIVEIKCPSSAYGMDPEEAIKQKKIDFWKYAPNSSQLLVNTKNKWYFQIQGQLRVTGEKACVFAVWTGPGKIKYEIINKDDQFWKENMEVHLIRFYKNCLLPELIDPRFKRNMSLREHSSHSHNNTMKTHN